MMNIEWSGIMLPTIIFLGITLALVSVLLFAKKWLVSESEVTVDINDGTKDFTTKAGQSVLSTLASNGVHLSSACGGKGSCGQCKLQILEGGGEMLPTESVHFTRSEIKNNWRLGCQVKVKNDLKLQMDPGSLNVKEWECEVVSNRNVATFIKEFIVKLPEGEHLDFIPGSYAQIRIPAFDMSYGKDIDKEFITKEYLPAWENFGLFELNCKNREETVRAYSMANYPEEGDRIMLTVRIATPPMLPKPKTGFANVSPGIASSYIFTLRPGDKVIMSGPYGDFHPHIDTQSEMIWVGGGAGMAPLRAQIMWMLRTRQCRDRKMHFFYGARALNEVFYLDDFLALEKEFPNFKFHLALDRPDPVADQKGVAYTAGFVHNVMYETYLKNHPSPEDIEYYMCGPGPMSNAVNKMLYDLGVEPDTIFYDNFGA